MNLAKLQSGVAAHTAPLVAGMARQRKAGAALTLEELHGGKQNAGPLSRHERRRQAALDRKRGKFRRRIEALTAAIEAAEKATRHPRPLTFPTFAEGVPVADIPAGSYGAPSTAGKVRIHWVEGGSGAKVGDVVDVHNDTATAIPADPGTRVRLWRHQGAWYANGVSLNPD